MKAQVEEATLKIHGFTFTTKAGEPLLFEGIPILKAPWDIGTILSIVKEVKPDVIVETGTAFGGSALLYSKVATTVVTIEDRSHYAGDGTRINPHTMQGYIPKEYVLFHYPRITYIERPSTDKQTLEEVKGICMGRKVLVNLDSDHHSANVLAELYAYADLVSTGSYLIVEDMRIEYVHVKHGPGPNVAVKQFLSANKAFEAEERWNDRRSLNFGGYLRRIK